MIKAVEGLKPIDAVGLLARATLSLSYLDNATGTVREGEETLRRRIVEEVRSRLGLAGDDYTESAIERMGDVLDAETDALLAPPDTNSALTRLAERGDLPSDLYEIDIIPTVADQLGKRFALEKEVIETTIRAPTVEQHFGPARGPHEPAMISLFLRTFRTRWPYKDFSMLVAGGRDGFRLQVHQAWRIYPARVNVAGLATLVDWLRRFAEVYGAKIEIDGKEDNFFLFVNGNVPNSMKWQVPPKTTYVISRFFRRDPITNAEQSALVVAVNVNKYLGTLDELGVKREDILDEFVPAPRARE
jgi:hypothetical protein